MKSLNLAASDHGRINGLLGLDDAAALIRAGAPLAIAGREAALDALPLGNWIGGTTPYFLTDLGGEVIDDSKVFVTDFSGLGAVHVAIYDEHQLAQISEDAPENGFALAIIPFQSAVHETFAKEASTYPLAFLKPTVGWIAGFDLGEAGALAHVYDGRHAIRHTNRAAVLHVELPEGALPQVEIVNIFEADDADTLTFETDSFTQNTVLVNGKPRDFAEYIRERGLETGQLPLVGDYSGARINASLRTVSEDSVQLYAPVFKGINYAFAKPVSDYAAAFRANFAAQPHDGTVFSCNCILNFLFGELEGKAVGGAAGPFTFGEIAYSLVNQTLVQLRAV